MLNLCEYKPIWVLRAKLITYPTDGFNCNWHVSKK
jgi:hypothetical protein